jgi:tripartite-type tricarboxylate transporter receptor subunit TctC
MGHPAFQMSSCRTSRNHDPRIRTGIFKVITVLVVVSSSALVEAQDAWPARTVRLVVPSSPGGGTDMFARLLAQGLADGLKQQFIVDNRAGAGGNIGAEIAARAAPDGYTLVMGTVGTHGINFSLYSNPGFDPVKDFVGITRVAVLPSIIVVNPSLPVNNLQELIAYAKANPGKLAYGSAGNLLYLTGAMLTSAAGIDMLHVPFKGAGPQLSALSNNDVQVAVTPVFSAMPMLKLGKARGLAVTSAKRSSAVPEVPTVAESGIPGYEAVSWYGLLAPAHTPPEIVAKLSTETRKVLATKEFQNALHSQGAEPVSDTLPEFAAIIRADTAKWAQIVKQTGAKAD